MDLVSSFFENILTVEPEMETDDKKIKTRSMTELDFSSLWNYGKSTDAADPTTSTTSKRTEDPKKPPQNTNSLLADKLLEKLVSLALPLDINDYDTNRILNERIEMQKSRLQLSMNIMSKHTIQLNQRLSIPMVMVDAVLKFFNWTNPAYTIGVLLIATHLVLNPFLVGVLPIIHLLGNVLIPHYLMIYPPDSSLVPDYFEYNPVPAPEPLHTYKVPKPAPQYSREFLLNLTDLQNHMVFYIYAYDFVVWLTSDYLYFKDENVSTLVYLGLIAALFHNLVIVPRVAPILWNNLYLVQIVIIASVWLFVLLFHPYIRTTVLEWMFNEDTRVRLLNITDRVEQFLATAILAPDAINDGHEHDHDFEKEVEIYELQKLNKKTNIWELVGFTNYFYTINVSQFIGSTDNDDDAANDNKTKLNKKRSMGKIQPPKDWCFSDDDWSIDLYVSEWVESNLIKDLVTIDEDEKWVYDYQDPKDNAKDVFRRRRWTRKCQRESTLDERKALTSS